MDAPLQGGDPVSASLMPVDCAKPICLLRLLPVKAGKGFSILGAGEERTPGAVSVAHQYNPSCVDAVFKAAAEEMCRVCDVCARAQCQ